MLALLHVEEIWKPDRREEAQSVFNSTSLAHPGVDYLLNRSNPCYIGGRLEGVQAPSSYDFKNLRLPPAELRRQFGRQGWRRIVAFQTRNPMHRAHVELTFRACREAEASLLIHPAVGMTKPGDVDYFTRVRCYQAVLTKYPRATARLALLPLAMRMAGPREAMWHAIIRKNCGCSHMIIGRDHAGPGKDTDGKAFYQPYAAQELFQKYEAEIGVTMLPFHNMVYVEDKAKYLPENEVIQELRRTFPPRHQQGFTIFFTGLSGAGKSTIANVLVIKLLEIGGRPVTLFDGDLVRKHLSSELGFSREHRDLNIRRIGYVASEITKNRGIAICAPIAPYDATRKEVRAMIAPLGGFIMVHLSTPVTICEKRDRKGLYAKARAGIIKEFTGISDPYEEPTDADITIDTTGLAPDEAAQEIILHLESEGLIGDGSTSRVSSEFLTP